MKLISVLLFFVMSSSSVAKNVFGLFEFGGRSSKQKRSSGPDVESCEGAGAKLMVAGAKGCQEDDAKQTKIGGACTPSKPVTYCLGGKSKKIGDKIELASGGVKGKSCHGIDCSGFIMGKLCSEGKMITAGKPACDMLGEVQTRQMYDEWGASNDSCFSVVGDDQVCDGDILVRKGPGEKPGHVITISIGKDKSDTGCLPKSQVDDAKMAHSGGGSKASKALNGPSSRGLMKYLKAPGAGKMKAMFEVIKNLGKGKKAQNSDAKLLRYSKEDRCKPSPAKAAYPKNIECLKRKCPQIQELAQCFPSK